MKSLIINKITIIDIHEKEAYQTEFKKGFNVITGLENHVGKSSLIKSIFYALGAEVFFDGNWNKETKLVSLEFYLSDKQLTYTISRLNKRYLLCDSNGKILVKTESVSKELSPVLAELFDFKIYLSNKSDGIIELSPPVYYYLPYYIDQDKGWTNSPFNSFERLEQYNKRDRLKTLYYHLGLYNQNSIDCMAEIEQVKQLKIETERYNEKLLELRRIFESEFQQNQMIEHTDLDLEVIDLKNDLSKELATLDGLKQEIADLETNLGIFNHYLQYYTNQSDEWEQIMCPNCGSKFDNCIDYKRIIQSKIVNIDNGFSVEQIRSLIVLTMDKLQSKKITHSKIINTISELKKNIFRKESFREFAEQLGLEIFSQNIDSKISKTYAEIAMKSKEVLEKEKDYKKKTDPRILNTRYKDEVINYLVELGAWDDRFNGKITLLQPYQAQGNLSVKSILASYLAFYNLLRENNNEIIRFPFIVDSPRSKEASKSSSKEILSHISRIDSVEQIIVATVDYDLYDDLVSVPTHKIYLGDEKQLLQKDIYISIANEKIITFMKESQNWV